MAPENQAIQTESFASNSMSTTLTSYCLVDGITTLRSGTFVLRIQLDLFMVHIFVVILLISVMESLCQDHTQTPNNCKCGNTTHANTLQTLTGMKVFLLKELKNAWFMLCNLKRIMETSSLLEVLVQTKLKYLMVILILNRVHRLKTWVEHVSLLIGVIVETCLQWVEAMES